MVAGESLILSSWKDIAGYLGKGVRTVQRWEKDFGLPVRRPIGASQKSAVLLHRADVDAWLTKRFMARTSAKDSLTPRLALQESVRADLSAQLERARQLRDANQVLVRQMTDAVAKLVEKCDLLRTQTSKCAALAQQAVTLPLAPHGGRPGNEKIA